MKCAKNSKGPRMEIFCTFLRRGLPPHGFCAKFARIRRGGGGGRWALSGKLPR